MKDKKSTLKERMQDEGLGIIKKDAKFNEKPIIETEYVDEDGNKIKKSSEDYL